MSLKKLDVVALVLGILLLSLSVTLEIWWQNLICLVIGIANILLFTKSINDVLALEGETNE